MHIDGKKRKDSNLSSCNYSHLMLDKEAKTIHLQEIVGKLDVHV